jgi:phosphoserine phosphatase
MDYIATLLAPFTKDEIKNFLQGLNDSGAQVKSEGSNAAENAYHVTFFASAPISRTHYPACDFTLETYPPARKQLLISDMDSTMIGQECIDELADFVGKKDYVAAITERAMRGELVFEDALRERVALLKGLPMEKLEACFKERITPMAGAKELIAAFKKQGGKCVLVSGGFTFFTERVAKLLGFDEHYANTLEMKDGALTGNVIEPILGKEAKLAELHRQCDLLKIGHSSVMALGDGANDLPMLKAAGLGIAYYAKPLVQAETHARISRGTLVSLIPIL